MMISGAKRQAQILVSGAACSVGYAVVLVVVIEIFDNVGDTFSDKYLVFVALAGV